MGRGRRGSGIGVGLLGALVVAAAAGVFALRADVVRPPHRPSVDRPGPDVARPPEVVVTPGPLGPVVVATRARPTPPPAAQPTATPLPLPTAVVAGPAEPWLRTVRETGLWSGPDGAAQEFVKVAAGTTVQALADGGPRMLVYVAADDRGRRAGEAWVDRADLEPTTWPRWARGRRATTLRQDARPDAPIVAALPPGAYVEILGEHRGPWALAFYLGDGRAIEPIEGWVVATDVGLPAARQEQLATVSLDRATLLRTPPEVWLRVPHWSQLDGAPYSDANCGPTTVAMILDAFGKADALARVRAAALALQGEPDCDTCGLFIEHLAAVAEARGVPTFGLRGRNDAFRRWTLEDIRAELRAGRIVIPQVMYRQLPGRGTSGFWGDHYIVLTGILGDRFIYNDPMDYDGPGYGRVIAAEALERAMVASDFPRVAFAAGT